MNLKSGHTDIFFVSKTEVSISPTFLPALPPSEKSGCFPGECAHTGDVQSLPVPASTGDSCCIRLPEL